MRRFFLDDFSGPPHSDLVVDGDCPNKANHTPSPRGYVAWHEWAEQMQKTDTQIACESCGLWAIWLPHVDADREIARRRAEAVEADRKYRGLTKAGGER